MDTKYSCPICNDTGWVFMKNDKGYEYAADCKCKVLKASMKRLERSGLAKEFKTKSFDNFYTDNNSMLEDA